MQRTIDSMESSSLIPKGLSDAETKVYQDLRKIANNRRPVHVAVISDLAVDYDDLMGMILLAELDRLDLVILEVYIANLSPAEKRARFGRGALDSLGFKRIIMGVGSAGSVEGHKVQEYEFGDCKFMAKETQFETGESLLVRLLEAAVREGKKITLVLLSSLMDISDFAKKHPDLLKNAVDHISIQGGVCFDGDTAEPDFEATNNCFAPGHAQDFTSYVQEYGIRTTVYTKQAAYATDIESDFFARLAKTGHILGQHLKRTQIIQDKTYYNNIISGTYRHRTQGWFIKHKTSWPVLKMPYPTSDEIEPYLTVVVAYDALAALGASGEQVLGELCVLKQATLERAATHVICQVGEEDIDGDRMAIVIQALLMGALSLESLPTFES